MSALAAPLKRYSTVLVTLLATAVVTLTMLVGAPQAQARPYHLHCVIVHHRVHHGERDKAQCIHGPKKHSGVAYVMRREVHRVGRPHHKHRQVVWKRYVVGRFQTNGSGTSTVHFRIPRWMPLGKHWVHFQVRHQHTRDWIRVVRRHH